jgi:hypothetical protein
VRSERGINNKKIVYLIWMACKIYIKIKMSKMVDSIFLMLASNYVRDLFADSAHTPFP